MRAGANGEDDIKTVNALARKTFNEFYPDADISKFFLCTERRLFLALSDTLAYYLPMLTDGKEYVAFLQPISDFPKISYQLEDVMALSTVPICDVLPP
jgi:hypothetical protein